MNFRDYLSNEQKELLMSITGDSANLTYAQFNLLNESYSLEHLVYCNISHWRDTPNEVRKCKLSQTGKSYRDALIKDKQNNRSMLRFKLIHIILSVIAIVISIIALMK